MKRIAVDFNTVMQDVEHDNRVILGMDDDVARGELPVLRSGEHVLAYDEEMEVEGVVEHRGAFWLAALEWDTIKRFETL